MNKKAQGISINTIIIAAIALIVLVVLVAIFTGRLGGFARGVLSCEDKGGVCIAKIADKTESQSCEAQNMALYRGTDCAEKTKNKQPICCIPVMEPTST